MRCSLSVSKMRVFDPFMAGQRNSSRHRRSLQTRKINLLSRNFSRASWPHYLLCFMHRISNLSANSEKLGEESGKFTLFHFRTSQSGQEIQEKLFWEYQGKSLCPQGWKGVLLLPSQILVFLEIPMVLYMHNSRLTFFCGKRIPAQLRASRPSLPQYGSIFNFLQS